MLATRRFHVEVPLAGPSAGLKFLAVLSDDQGEICRAEVPADAYFSPALDDLTAALAVTTVEPSGDDVVKEVIVGLMVRFKIMGCSLPPF